MAVNRVKYLCRGIVTAILLALVCVNVNILAGPWWWPHKPLETMDEAGIGRDPQSIQAVLLDDRRDPELRLLSALALAQMEHRESVPFLIKAIDEDEHKARFGAVTALIFMPSVEAVPKLCSVVHSSPDGRLRRQAVTALSQTDSQSATQCISDAALNEAESVDTRRSALWLLWDVKETVESVDGLVPLLESADTKIRALTALCLQRSYDRSRAIQESLGIPDALVSAAQNPELDTSLFYDVVRAIEAFSGEQFVDDVIHPLASKQFMEYFDANRHLVAEDIRIWSESRER